MWPRSHKEQVGPHLLWVEDRGTWPVGLTQADLCELRC